MDGTCSMHGVMRNAHKILIGMSQKEDISWET